MSELLFDVDLASEIKKSFANARGNNESRWVIEDICDLANSPLFSNILDVLQGRAEIRYFSQTEITEREKGLIVVDRTVRPTYWNSNNAAVVHPDLENTGPTAYCIIDLETYHTCFAQGISTWKFYQHLLENGLITRSLGLRDLEEIKKKGFVFFQDHFKSEIPDFHRTKKVIAWKSAVRYGNSNYYFPSLEWLDYHKEMKIDQLHYSSYLPLESVTLLFKREDINS